MSYEIPEIADLLGPVEPAASVTAPAQNYSEGEFAALLGVSTRWVRDLVADGTLSRVKGAPRVIYAADQVTAYCAFIRAKAGADVDKLKAAKLRAAEADAETREMKAAKMRGDLVSVSKVKDKWSEIIADVRATILAVPSHVGAEQRHLAPTDIAAIDKQLKRALERLSNDAS